MSVVLTACGPTPTSTPTVNALRPAAVGSALCPASRFSDGSVYAQVTLAKTNCEVAASVASRSDSAKGGAYTASGFSCSATKEAGSGSPWAAAWGSTYYAYSCARGGQEVAFNWGTDYTYGSSSSGSSTPTPSPSSGALQPAALGQGDCQAVRLSDGSVYAQIAVANTTCAVADSVAGGADSARGSAYSAAGFACAPTTEGAGSPWAGAWGSTYYAYSCADGGEQVAFNWGTDYTY
ncbi:MAG: hypothetical protein WB801_10665 [Candidatus Dormiibacterota bacterium]